MSRHRGRPRPLAAHRFYYPRHCTCPFFHGPYDWRQFSPFLFDAHTVRTVAPR